MPQVDRAFDVETDLLVVGAGAAGMTAALVGALEGLQVILCEKSDMVGGTTATSAGTVWIPGNRQGERAGTPDTVAAARTYLAAMLGEHATDQRLDMFLEAGPIVLDYLEQKTSVRFAAPPVHPDYKNLAGAAIGGRALGAIPFDGRKLGHDFARVRPPRREFMVLGGMMVGKADIPALLAPFGNLTNLRHAAGLLARHALDRISYKRGTRLIMGNALVARLFAGIRRAGVDLRFETGLRDIICDGDAVVGAVLSSPAGELRIHARKGVVLATGGIGWNRELRERLFPEAARRYSLAPSSNTGDGILAAERINADIVCDLDSPALWMPSSVMAQADGHVSVFPHIMLDRAKPGLLAVNQTGRRFVNEADSYHDFVAAMLRSNASASAAAPAFLICDRTFIRDFGIGLVHPGTKNLTAFLQAGYLMEGETIEALAHKIDVDGEGFAETVERYNRYAETGIDDDFGRGSSALNRVNGDPLTKPNPCLRRIGPGPLYAVAVWPSDLAGSAGLRTDSRARVVAHDGKFLPGLYAVGTDSSSIFRGTYPGPGTMIGPAIVFAWCAAMDAAGALRRFSLS
ncbi:FAD-dependent oxidoreductase [Bradyrhizobium betae]|uniref:FAD-dependent oxidoreductase n=1 Tax=Bradyrhizobium betae TaxID=244734 RepID=A0A5P6PFF0_9BRAD|nr:FAD-dependent oxidoreductase [Bradyrhizobium betae]MCS3726044.1 succinate dehydrogenase/fumarate reductase flavoprotein subunit [Bradyrhizobium betae]QFI76858.1 FAD-dependent oxidoreductase [Bradyrhizobium betae]